ncbi:MAG: LacI family DNA-binding transcriptional regulator [Ruminococcus sp.]|nr:LacI family DNA-binding transcriptional regulator [Ruminococcus sp.]
MNENRIRISDIAEELGLSTATVSYVLHGKTDKVSDRTVRRVLALLEERKYLPGVADLLLGQNSSKIVGVVVNDHEKYEDHPLEDAFIASALNALSVETVKNDLQLMVRKISNLEEIISFSTMWNLEGLVLIGFCAQDYGHLREHMRIPFVVYDGCGVTAERTCCINIDDYQGGFLVGEYFRESGHRHALCISDNDIDMDRERWKGFCDGFGLKGAGLMLVPLQKSARKSFYMDNLNKIREYTAIFAVSDYYAADLMHFLSEQGISVPDEISVAGFDDTPLCHMVYPSLTSVRQDTALRAEIAIEKLRQLKLGKHTELSVTIPVTLIERNSTRSFIKN